MLLLLSSTTYSRRTSFPRHRTPFRICRPNHGTWPPRQLVPYPTRITTITVTTTIIITTTITTTPNTSSPPRHQHHVITIKLSQPRHHHHAINITSSPPRHYHYVFTVLSYHQQQITTSTTTPSPIYQHRHVIATALLSSLSATINVYVTTISSQYIHQY